MRREEQLARETAAHLRAAGLEADAHGEGVHWRVVATSGARSELWAHGPGERACRAARGDCAFFVGQAQLAHGVLADPAAAGHGRASCDMIAR